MKLKPIATEKSMAEAKHGKYTFGVDPSLTKNQIKELISKSFGVNVIGVQTINKKSSKRRTVSGKFITTKALKKAIVSLKKGQKIDIFDQPEEKK